jgi:hypothetical protein
MAGEEMPSQNEVVQGAKRRYFTDADLHAIADMAVFLAAEEQLRGTGLLPTPRERNLAVMAAAIALHLQAEDILSRKPRASTLQDVTASTAPGGSMTTLSALAEEAGLTRSDLEDDGRPDCLVCSDAGCEDCPPATPSTDVPRPF